MGVDRSVGRGWGLAIVVGFLLATLLTATPASAAAPEPWPETRLTTEHWYTALASAEDAQGRLHLAARRTGTDAGIRYLRQVGDGWVEEAVSPDRRGWSVAIAFDPSGRPVIAWDHANGQLRIATRTADGWTVERVAAKGYGGDGLALAIDADGHRHVASYGGYDSGLRYTTDRSGSWSTLRLGRVDPYSPPALAATPDGIVWLASAVPFGWTNGIQRIRATRIDGDRVTTKRLGIGWSPRVTFDDAGRPIVAWEAGRGIAVERFGDRGWQRLGLLRASTFGFLGLDVQGDRIGVAIETDGERRIGEAVAILDASGRWSRTEVADWLTCTPSGLHLVGAERIELPCLEPHGYGDGVPGIGLHTIRGSTVSRRSIAPQERFTEAFTAQAPDGHLEVLTVRQDGHLVLHRPGTAGWVKETVPPMSSAAPTAFTIGPDGDRAIVGESRGSRLVLLTDRGGAWRHTALGAGFSPQVTIDRDGRYHVGYVRKDGWRRTLWVAVGRPGSWRRSEVPRSLISDFSRETFLVEPDGTDAVVWARRGDRDGKNGGIRLARWDGRRWTVDRLGHDGYTELWSAAMAPDGTIGIVRGGLLSNNLQLIRGERRTIEPLPGVTFFGGSLLFDPRSRPAILAQGWDLGRLLVLRKLADGWHRTTVIQDRWEEARLAMTGDGPAVLIGRHVDRSRTAGWFVLTQPS